MEVTVFYQRKWFHVFGVIFVTMGIAIADYMTSQDFGFSIFYLIPITFTSWRFGMGAVTGSKGEGGKLRWLCVFV